MAAIEILGLEKTYSVGFWRKRPKRALKPLHLRVEEGEIFGFLGPNGAGKTTTLKLLMGLVFPTAGSARILGHGVQHPRSESADRLSARTALFLRLPDCPRIAGILRTAFRSGRKRPLAPGRRDAGPSGAARTLRGVQLRKFSKGMLQRVGIAQAILHDPKVVIPR